MGYYCQNCLAAISLDETLQKLSNQQLQLLVNRLSKPAPRCSFLAPKCIPKDRLDLYNQAIALSQAEPELRKVAPTGDPGSYDLQRSFVYVHDEDADEARDSDEDPATHLPSSSEDETNVDGEQLPDFSKVNSLNHVFQILLTNQDVGHPMCKECANLLTENYKLKFDHMQREKEQYASFLKKLKDRSLTSATAESELDSKLNEAEHELQELQNLEQTKLKELEDLENTHAGLLKDIGELDARLKDLEETQLSELFHAKNTFNSNLRIEQGRLNQAKALHKKHLNQLDRLRSFNVYSKLFEILFDAGDGYGRINGCRLGYKVPWPELNVSLGHVARLVLFLMQRLGEQPHPYLVVPMGLKSYIVKQGSEPEGGTAASSGEAPLNGGTVDSGSSSRGRQGVVLPLFSSNEFTLGKLFNYNSADVSMLALLDILAKFEQNLIRRDEELAFPYVINMSKGTIGGRSIRLSSNGPWTEACRYLLTDLNWILSYVSAQPADDC